MKTEHFREESRNLAKSTKSSQILEAIVKSSQIQSFVFMRIVEYE